MTGDELSRKIKNAKKSTPVRLFMTSSERLDFKNCKAYGCGEFSVIFGAWEDILPVISENRDKISDFTVEPSARQAALEMSDILGLDARVEYGAHIREGVKIGAGAVVMHGAVINSGAEIGEGTMVDMNSVVGSCAIIGKSAHIGAGAVIAGVLEPCSNESVNIGDFAFIGANAVVLEGVKIGESAVIGAGAVVTEDIPRGKVAVGIPARVVGERDKIVKNIDISKDLRE